jgi:hypothetical protein
MKSKFEIGFTSSMGRGRRVAPGEGLCSIDRPHALTPTLSPREREHAVVAAAPIVDSDRGEAR